MSIAAWLLSLQLVEVGDSLRRFAFREVHLGMDVRITGYAPNDSTARAAAAAAFAEVARLEDIFSDWRAGSEVRRLEGRPGTWQPVSPELFSVLRTALDVARATDGAFDPTVGPLTGLWREARRTGAVPSPATLTRARRAVGYRHLGLDPREGRVRLARSGMRLDLGGIAKGFILQRAVGVLATHGVTRVLVEAGGDIAAGDAPPGRAGWTVSAPFADSIVSARATSLRRQSLATSGPTEQFRVVGDRRESHVLDVRSGRGIVTPEVASVIGTNGAIVDAVATALTTLSPARGRELLRRYGLIGSLQVPPSESRD